MPRVSVRKAFIYLLGVASVALLALNVHQNMVNTSTGSGPGVNIVMFPSSWTGSGSGPSAARLPKLPGASASAKSEMAAVASVNGTKNESSSRKPINSVILDPADQDSVEDLYGLLGPLRKMDMLTPLEEDDLSVPVGSQKAWYMREGGLFPDHCPVNDDGKRELPLYPEEEPELDRITQQLMFLPPKGAYPGKILHIFDENFNLITHEISYAVYKKSFKMTDKIVKTHSLNCLEINGFF